MTHSRNYLKNVKKEGAADVETLNIIDQTECRFDVNSYHIIYVINSGAILYRYNALLAARKVRAESLYLSCQQGHTVKMARCTNSVLNV